MAVTPVVDQHSDNVLTRLAERRTQLEALIGAVHDHSFSLADVFARAGDPSVTTLEPDALVCRFVYLVKIAEALPGVGKVRARRVLADHGYGERTRVGDVAVNDRDTLVQALR
jgi:hypothetical protein